LLFRIRWNLVDPGIYGAGVAQGDRVVELLRESVEAYTCLFEGTRGAVMEEAAPYLVELPEASALLGTGARGQTAR
jgi:hypothetical protein